MKKKRNCRLCSTSSITSPSFKIDRAPKSVNDLPVIGAHLSEHSKLLSLWQCPWCSHFQLDKDCIVPTWRAAISAAGLSKKMRTQRLKQFENFKDFSKSKTILEIGAGEGLFLPLFDKVGFKAQGLEWSVEQVKKGRLNGLDLVQGHPLDNDLVSKNITIESFACINFLEHATEPVEMLRNIQTVCIPNAFGLIEVPNFEKDLTLSRSHNLVAEHLSYFTQETFALALELSGFEIVKMEEFWNGDDLTAWVKVRNKRDLLNWSIQDPAFSLFRDFLEESTEPTSLWGASHQALTLLAMQDSRPRLNCIADSSPTKQGRMDPSWVIPIVSPQKMIDMKSTRVLIMAAGYSDEVSTQLRQMNFKGVIAILLDGKLHKI